jgi:hypothetical protein
MRLTTWLLLVSACDHKAAMTADDLAMPDLGMPADDLSVAADLARADAATVGDAASTDAYVYVPATPQSPPRDVSEGGSVLTQPVVRVVTFGGDPLASDVEAFAAQLGASSYWAATTSEYGIGALTAGPPLHLPVLGGSSIDDAQLEQMLTDNVTAADMGPWGSPEPSTIYAFIIPQGVTVTDGSQTSCTDFFGYHQEADVTASTHLPYVVVTQCSPQPAVGLTTALDMVTGPLSHELIEATANPYPFVNPTGYDTLDSDHLAWQKTPFVNAGQELTDLCTQIPNHFVKEGGYTVQRSWSNAAMQAGHDPCVPNLTGSVYYQSEPVGAESLSVPAATKGWRILPGTNRTIELDLYSDGPTAGPWDVFAFDQLALTRGTADHLSFQLDRAGGASGDKLHLTISVGGLQNFDNIEVFAVASRRAGDAQPNLWYGLVYTQ